MRLASGHRLGPYEIVGPLGAGGMGEVYQALDTRLGRQVAIKVLSRSDAGEGLERRFERESRAASTLSHPNVVTIYDVGRFEGGLYIVMELVSGRSLRQLLSGGQVSLRKLIDLAAQVAEGLAAAHAAGIELLGLRAALQVEPKPDFLEPDGRLLVDRQGATEVEVALGGDGATRDRYRQGGGDGSERDARTGNQSLEQHVARTCRQPVATGGRVQPGFDQRSAGLHLARDGFGADSALGPERDDRRCRLLPIPRFQRLLQGSQSRGVHIASHAGLGPRRAHPIARA